MRTGVLLLQDASWSELAARASRIESMGADTLWIGDHFTNPYAPAAPWLEAWTLLGALAGATRRVTLGALASSLTLRNPVLLVRAVVTLDHVSGGRAELALGAGGAPLDHAMTGVPPWTKLERGARLAEAVGLVRELLDHGRVGPVAAGADLSRGAARFYAATGTIIEPRAVAGRAIRCTVAALGPRAIGVAARFADGWNSYGVGGDRDVRGLLPWDRAMTVLAERSRVLDGACHEVGRDPRSIGRSYLFAETYGTGLPQPVRFRSMVADLAAAGIDEVMLYWPTDPADEGRLGELLAIASSG